MKWFIVDMREVETWVAETKATTRAEAEALARDEFSRLAKRDQKRVISFEAILAPTTEEGFLDWDNIADYITIK